MSQCNVGFTCVEAWNPNFGITSFDNILKAMLQIFVIMTLEGWTEIMYYIRRVNKSYIYDFYFFFIVVFGTYFVLNLMIAVQTSYLNQTIEEQNRQKRELKEKNSDTPGLPAVEEKKENEEEESPSKKGNEESPNKKKGPFEVDSNNFERFLAEEGIQSQEIKRDEILETDSVDDKVKNTFKYKLQALRHRVYIIVESKPFNIFILVVIMINTLFLSLVYYDMPTILHTILDYGNMVFTVFFAIEMLVKLFGMGFRLYVEDGFNDFDAVIVLVGLLEFLNIESKAVTVFRTFRLLRIFKIIRAWPSLRRLLQVVLKSLWPLSNLFLLMILFCFIYGLMGYQFFNGQVFDDYDEEPRYVFTDFSSSMITIWTLLTGEDSNTQIYLGIS